MFSCCHPRLTGDVQVALVLNILCGFGAAEIAGAFLLPRTTIEKRIARGKNALARAKRLFDLADADFAARLSAVRRALYLLFSEGYHGSSTETSVRSDVCGDALRLTLLLFEAPAAAEPETHALAALMCLQAARLPARVNEAGDLSSLFEQDRSRWDRGLIQHGLALLDRSATGPTITPYHVEAAIAAVHATAPTAEATDWSAIVSLYDRLMTLSGSPVVALNRAIAIAQRDGPEQGLEALRTIADVERLEHYPFYEAALGELERRRGNPAAAKRHFVAAMAAARSPAERRFLDRRAREG